MFRGLKQGIVNFSNANNFGGTAESEFVYFTILCSNFLQKFTIEKVKKFTFLAISLKSYEVKKCTVQYLYLILETFCLTF